MVNGTATNPIKIDAIKALPVDALMPYANNARTHSAEQVAQIAASIKEFGFNNPVLIDAERGIIAGHGRLEAARLLGLESVPTIEIAHLTEAQRKAYILADNKLALNAGWDVEALRVELEGLQDLDFDLGLIGFDISELAGFLDTTEGLTDPDAIPEAPEPVAQLGDVWALGRHRLICGDSTDMDAVEVCIGGGVDLCLTDPPYGIGLDYGGFTDSVENVAELAIDWLPIARDRCAVVVFSSGITCQWLYPTPDWVICWFYGGGQLKSPWGFNCWQPFLAYGKDPSLANRRGARPDAVDMNTPANAKDLNHPCPKPMKLWEWMIARLSFKQADIIYDPFCGSGTTIIAAEMTGRACYAIELNPTYVDVAIKRWEDFTGETASHA